MDFIFSLFKIMGTIKKSWGFGSYTGEMSNYDISSKNGVTLAVMYFNAAVFLNHSLRLFSKMTPVIKLRLL